MKQSKHTTSYWHKLMGVVLLVSVVLCNLVGLVSAKFVQVIDAGSITVAKNYYTVTYYDSDNTTPLHTVTEWLKDEHTVLSPEQIKANGGDELNTPTDAGEFLGWVDKHGLEPDLTVKEDYGLYPSFETTYTVTYYNSDGSVMYKATELIADDYHKVLSLDEVQTKGETTLNPPEGAGAFLYWVNAAGTKVEGTLTQKVDYKLYPYFEDPRYSVRFIDGGILTLEATFTKGQTAAEAGIKAPEPITQEDLTFIDWVVGSPTSEIKWDGYDLSQATEDVLVYATYEYAGDVSLTPVDNASDGVVDEYHVSGYGKGEGQFVVDIPAKVSDIPVTTINQGAFSSFEHIHAVVIPTTITSIGKNAFAADWERFDTGETITIYYEGTLAQWNAIEKVDEWDHGLGAGSRIFFLGEDGKVDTNQGYLLASVKTTGLFIKTATDISWADGKESIDSLIAEYTGVCECDECNGADRPDKAYWIDDTAN